MGTLVETTVKLRGAESSVRGVVLLLKALEGAARAGGVDFVRVMVNARDGFLFAADVDDRRVALTEADLASLRGQTDKRSPTFEGLQVRRAPDEHGTPTLYLELV